MKIDDKFEKLPAVYVITNMINGKRYVGESMDIFARMQKYQQFAAPSKELKDDLILLGKDNFNVDVEYKIGASKLDLLDYEEIVIKNNDSINNGYNQKPRGVHGKYGMKCSLESRKKMSEAHKGKRHTKETRLKISRLRKQTSPESIAKQKATIKRNRELRNSALLI